TQEPDVEFQFPKDAVQRVAVHAQCLSSPTLIRFLLSQNGKNEDLWNSRSASEYRVPLLCMCSTSFSSCSFTANSPQRCPVEFRCSGHSPGATTLTIFDENGKCSGSLPPLR